VVEDAIGIHLYDHSDSAGAIPHHQRALAVTEKALGREHRDVGFYARRLALDYIGLDQPLEARPWVARALEVAEHNFGPEHPTIAIVIGLLGPRGS
jgi:hypothetical protein